MPETSRLDLGLIFTEVIPNIHQTSVEVLTIAAIVKGDFTVLCLFIKLFDLSRSAPYEQRDEKAPEKPSTMFG